MWHIFAAKARKDVSQGILSRINVCISIHDDGQPCQIAII